MKLYTKKINGISVYKTRPYITISKNGTVTYNPSEEMILADGWEEYNAPEKTIEDYRQELYNEIINYDRSSSVNEFFIQDTSVWLDKNTRVGLRLRFESELSLSKEDTILWYNGQQFPLKIQDAINMLHLLEIYASNCYDNTQYHLSQIQKLQTIEEIQNYDFRSGYPQKLNF